MIYHIARDGKDLFTRFTGMGEYLDVLRK